MAVPKEYTSEQLTAQLGISDQHSEEVEKIMEYFKKHRINELFNEMMTNMLHKRPMEDPKQYVLETLKSIQVMSDRERKMDDPLN